MMYKETDTSGDLLIYTVSCKRRIEEFIGNYISYGIIVCDGNRCILESIDDITVAPEIALKICNLLTMYKVSVIHFRDVVLDLISGGLLNNN